MSAIQFTPADRDERGFIKAPAPPAEPRSLADLLPPVAPPADATIHRSPPTRLEIATMITLGILLLGIAVYLWMIAPARPAARPATPAAATAAPTAAPIPTPAAPRLTAYSAPGVPLGQIEATRAITEVAHYGADWIQAEVQFSGLVWLRTSDWPALAVVGPDLAPRPTIAPVYVEPPEATPEPPQCAEAGIPGKMVTVCGYDSLATLEERAKAKWLQTYGGNLGALDSPTPQLFRSTP